MEKQLFIYIINQYKQCGHEYVQLTIGKGETTWVKTETITYKEKYFEVEFFGRMTNIEYRVIKEIAI